MRNKRPAAMPAKIIDNEVSQAASLLKANINYLSSLLCKSSTSNYFSRLSAMIEFIVLPQFGLREVETNVDIKNNLELAALLSICEQQMNVLLTYLASRDPRLGSWVRGVFIGYAEQLRGQMLTNSPFNNALN